MSRTEINPYAEKQLKIYGYTTPQIPNHLGHVKIGETSRDVKVRVREQGKTLGVVPHIEFYRTARHKDGDWFHDRDLHRYIQSRDIKPSNLGDSKEWFDFRPDINQAEQMTDEFIELGTAKQQVSLEEEEYVLRDEQAQAVSDTLAYYNDQTNNREFLWNAKPRFGKTLTTYDFMLEIGAMNTLIVTNRPAIANSWYEDFHKFISHKDQNMKFVSETDSLKGKGMSRDKFVQLALNSDSEMKQVAFISLQDLKGAAFAGGPYDKLKWVSELNWDLLVIDEAHEGVDTLKTDRAFDKIKRNFTLHLSGTPFKAIANEKFTGDQIYNWSYLDEQQTKRNWDKEAKIDTNPYASLPTLSLFTYQMSGLIQDKIRQGANLEEDDNVDYAFDLNEFFSTNDNGKFQHEEAVKKFLDSLVKNKMPFSTTEYRHQLDHTFWLLPRVASAKALEVLLKKHPVFKDYHVVLAAGDGESIVDSDKDYNQTKVFDKNTKSYDKVKKAINQYPKTITLSVGQLTTGVTIPEWTAVLMLSNIKSPALYFQAAFRAQNPYEYEKDGKLYRKENAYVFDFAPERTLTLFDEFANNLTPDADQSTSKREDKIKTLLNFFPVIAEDDEGEMKELNAEEVLTIPQQIQGTEVVRRGFMSNLLFDNISGIFGAQEVYINILNKIKPEENKKVKSHRPVEVTDPMLDDQGNVDIPNEIVINQTKEFFGDKVFSVTNKPESAAITKTTDDIVKQIEPGISKLQNEFDLKPAQTNRLRRDTHRDIKEVVKKEQETYAQSVNKAQQEYDDARVNPENTKAMDELLAEKREKEDRAEEIYAKNIQQGTKEVLEKTVEKEQKRVETRKKNQTENDVRAHLRGFARTIPAFLMAYGSDETRLSIFEENIDPDTFLEITSITIEEFTKLRDGFDDIDEEGQKRHIPGLFNETVFNASIQAFFDKKHELGNYFDENLSEDIFDYIPSQKTNQIYTPRGVVKLMVDKLEEENPGIFTQKDTKFIDLYTKSGLYLTELVKRLNIGLADEIPDEKERIKWILEKQVYGVAPSDIIYNIAKNYVYGIHHDVDTSNLVQWDMAKSAQNGTMKEDLIEAYEGEDVKFDVVIGNPPYQEETVGTSDRPIYPEFMNGAYELAHKVSLITPARFLFNAGKTPKKWNEQMLADPHLKVSFYEQKSGSVFPTTDIKGGIAVTYRDSQKELGPIEVFVSIPTLSHILDKVKSKTEASFSQLVYAPESYRLTEQLHKDFPEAEGQLSKGHKYDITTNIFNKLPFVFLDNVDTDEGYVQIYGREDNQRVTKYVKAEYISGPDNFEYYKILVPKSNGSGAIGEVLSTPLLGTPLLGHTQTFLSIGKFENKMEADACLKYVKTKFARCMLGILKVTQDNKKKTWRYVPLQDFTDKSDIDWSKSIPEIDQQLYAKYGLSDDEIQFIETNVQEMK